MKQISKNQIKDSLKSVGENCYCKWNDVIEISNAVTILKKKKTLEKVWHLKLYFFFFTNKRLIFIFIKATFLAALWWG